MNSKRTLVIAPHTDDAELGCGGTIVKLLASGTEVFAVALSTAEQSVPSHLPHDTLKKEFFRAMPQLGVPPEHVYTRDLPVRRLSEYRQDVLEYLVRLRRELNPDTVLLPSQNDLHQDHQVAHVEGLRAFKDLTVFGYELPWNHITFSATAFVTLEEAHIEKKCSALTCYNSQIALNRPYFDPQFIRGWARMRGLQVKTEYAESFEVIRIKW